MDCEGKQEYTEEKGSASRCSCNGGLRSHNGSQFSARPVPVPLNNVQASHAIDGQHALHEVHMKQRVKRPETLICHGYIGWKKSQSKEGNEQIKEITTRRAKWKRKDHALRKTKMGKRVNIKKEKERTRRNETIR